VAADLLGAGLRGVAGVVLLAAFTFIGDVFRGAFLFEATFFVGLTRPSAFALVDLFRGELLTETRRFGVSDGMALATLGLPRHRSVTA
jgi:hypothetical protein